MATLATDEVEASPPSARRLTQAAQSTEVAPSAQQRDRLPSDRVVATRTQFCISLSSRNAALLADAAAPPAMPDLRGWSSPHGEPYRPLGKPDLSLKFTPRLADGSSLLQNAQRMRVFEGSKQHHGGHPGAQAGLKDKELREASETGATDSAQSQPALFDLFPFNVGSNRKRTLDERQVKFAYRLQESVANYSPEKVRTILRRPDAHSPLRFDHHNEDCQHGSGGGGGDSFDMLKEALQECSSRLRQVRNGASLLRQLPAKDYPVLLELREQYMHERAHALETRALRTSASQPGGPRQGRPVLSSAVDGRAAVSGRAGSGSGDAAGGLSVLSNSNEDKCYLPYTTRHLQHSPHRHLPSLDEVRAKVQEEKRQVPVRPLRNSYDASGHQQNRRPSGRSSRIVSTTVVGGARPLPVNQSHDLGNLAASRPSLLGDIVGPVGAASAHRSSHAPGTDNGRLGIPSKSDEKTNATQDNKPVQQRPSPTKLHSIERLQVAVSAMEDVKIKQSAILAQSIESLNQDRRDCLALKFKSFNVVHHADDDLVSMRKRSEMQRVQHIEQSVESLDWYEEMLRKLLAREGTGPPPHPAELFIVTAIRRLAHEGHEFTAALLFELLLHIHIDDFAATEVQDMLIYLQDVLAIAPDAWTSFFSDHGFRLPVETSERRSPAPEPTLHRIGSKLRAAVKVHQLIRHLSEKG